MAFNSKGFIFYFFKTNIAAGLSESTTEEYTLTKSEWNQNNIGFFQ